MIFIIYKKGVFIMMHHSPVIRTIGMITWVITALVSINTLTMLYDYDFFELVMRMAPNSAMVIAWIIGLSGLISLALFVKAMMFTCCPGCGSCPCTCDKINRPHNVHNSNNF